MADTPISFPKYSIKFSLEGIESRNKLPPEARCAIQDVIDKLAENPDAFPSRTKAISREVRVYAHCNPDIEMMYEVDENESQLRLLHFVERKVQVIKPAFISYSHKDAAWLEKLKKYLKPLQDQELIRIWDDTDIRPGSKWLEEIERSLESARVAVLLVTQDFLTSEFISQKEVPVLLEKAENRGCVIFWIAVSTSTWEASKLKQFEAANDPDNPLDTLTEPEQNRVLKSIYNRMNEAVQ